MCSTSAVGHQQSDLIGRLLIVIVNKFAYKSIPNTFLGCIEKQNFWTKSALATFWTTFWII